MPLKDIITYIRVDVSPILGVSFTSHEDIVKLLNDTFGSKYVGSTVVIPNNDLPALLIMSVLEFLRKQVSEIVIELPDGGYLLLFSVVPTDRYTRPESVKVYRELLSQIDEEPTKKQGIAVFDLASIPNEKNDDLLEIILPIKQKLRFADQVGFENESNSVVAAIVYFLWLPFARTIVYKRGQQEIKIR